MPRPSLVGRQRELSELTAALAAAISGRGGLVLLSGETGIGKTRLAEELGHRAQARGAKVLWGRCWEGEGSPPFWPWMQTIRGVADTLSPTELAAAAGSGAPYVAALVPELADKLARTPAPAASVDSEQARFYLFDATASFWKRISQSTPIVLVLDDLHWADKPSLLMLEFVARELRDACCLLIGTYREAQARQAGPLADLLAALARQAHTLPLRGLAETEVAKLVERATGTSPDPEVVASVHRATDGNPFFVDEIVRMLVAEGGRLPRTGALPIPEGVRSVIRRSLAMLPEEPRKVLSAASVVGRSFDLDLLQHACGSSATDLSGTLARATTAGFVERIAGTIQTYVFVHDLVRETLYEDLDPSVRQSLHRATGAGLEQLHAADLDFHLAELAHHFFQVPDEVASGIKYAVRAGDRAMGLMGYEEAARWYERALEALAGLRNDADRRCDLLLALGEARRKAGRVSGARDAFLAAADSARRLGSAERLGRAALGLGGPFLRVAGKVDRELTMLLEEALEAIQTGDDTLRARLAARLAMELYWSDETERRVSLSAEGVDIARGTRNPATLAYCLNAERQARWGPENPQERLSLADEMAAAAAQAREPELVQRAQGWRITDLLEVGKIADADVEIQEYARLADELRLPNSRCWATFVRAMRALLDGRFDEAETLALRALELGETAQARDAPAAFLTQMYTLRREQGRLAELEGPLLGVVEVSAKIPAWRAWLGLLYFEIGRPEEGRWQLESLAASGFGSVRRDLAWLSCMVPCADLCALADDPEHAAIVYEQLLPFAQRNVVVGAAWACWGSVSLPLGMLATTMLRWEPAERHFQDALEWNLRMGARAFVVRTRFHHAQMCARRGAPGDQARAVALLGRAEEDAHALGMTSLLEKIEKSRETWAAATSMPSAAPFDKPVLSKVEGLTVSGAPIDAVAEENIFRREGDTWTISCEGRSFRLKDSKGLRYLAELLHNPGREFPALDLAVGADRHEAAESVPVGNAGGVRVSPDLGDAGALLDAQARNEYRRRLLDLRESLADAERCNDPGRATRAREEIDFLTAELSRAIGLGGRERRAGSAAERARLSVTMAIKSALKRIAANDAPLGRHLAMTVKTGAFCTYTPDPRSPIEWTR